MPVAANCVGPMSAAARPAEPDRRRRLAATAAAVATILVLLALAAIIAREQFGGPATAGAGGLAGARGGDGRAALESVLEHDPHDTKALAELAGLAHAEGRWIEAATDWAKVARLDPLDGTARFEQARNLLASGDAAAVIALLGGGDQRLDADEEVILARALLMRSDLEHARVRVKAAVDADAERPGVRLLAADLAFIDGDDARAEAGYRALLDQPASAAAAALGLAQIAMRHGDTDVALDRLQAIEPDGSFQVLRARAELYRQLRRFDLAEADYRRLISERGPVPDAVVPLAELRASAGDREGVAVLRRSLTGTDTPALAAHHYLQAVEAYLGDDLVTARDYLGWARDYFGGRDLYRWLALDTGARLPDPDLAGAAVAAIERGVVTPQRKLRAAALLAGRAAVAVDAGDSDTARRLAELALRLTPDLPAATLVLARVALVDGDAERAAAMAGPLAQDGTYRGAALEVLGRVALSAGDLEQAGERFTALADRDPDAASGPYWLGITAYAAGDLDAAVRDLREARARRADPRIDAVLIDVLIDRRAWTAAEETAQASIDADDPRARARGWAWLGDVRAAQRQAAGAAEAYREAMAEDPDEPRYALGAADQLMTLRRWDEARDVLDAAAARHTDDLYLAFKRALLAQLSGDAADSEQRYRALLEARPEWPLPLVNLSELLAADPATATESLTLAERAADLAPNWVDARWNLAQRQAEASNRVAALESARSVLALAPDHAGAEALLHAKTEGP